MLTPEVLLRRVFLGLLIAFNVVYDVKHRMQHTEFAQEVEPRISAVTSDLDSNPAVPTGVRLPGDLRNALAREASINRRTLSAEIVARLSASLRKDDESSRGGAPQAAGDNTPAYLADRASMSSEQRLLLRLFDRMEPAQRLALLTLLKG